MTDTLKKANELMKRRLDDGPPETHLSNKEFAIALFGTPQELNDRITCHLKRCNLCFLLVEGEQARNPIYQGLQKALGAGWTHEEYHTEIKRLLKETKNEPITSDEQMTDHSPSLAEQLSRLIDFQKRFFARVADFIKKINPK